MRRFLSLALTPAVAAGILAVAAAPAGATVSGETRYSLGITTLTDLVVDAAHGHVYVTGGGLDGVLVRDLTGAALTTVTGQTGAAGMALSNDGSTLYVALFGADAVSAIDTTTLTETARWATGASTCPHTVGEAGTTLWFTYGCESTRTHVGAVERGGDAPVVSLGLADTTVDYADELLVAGDRLVVRDLSYNVFHVFDVAGTTLTRVGRRVIGDSAPDYALAADGTNLLVAAHNAEYGTGVYALPGLTTVSGYSTANYPNALAVAPGYVAASTNNWTYPDIEVWTTAGAHVRSFELGQCCGSTNSGTTIVARGLAFAPDASRLYAVTANAYGSDPLWLHALPDPTKHTSTVTLVEPPSGKVNTAFHITGKVAAEAPIPAGSVVHVTRSSKYGTVARPDVKTGTGGAFTITDTAYKRGRYTYSATWDGDATRVGATGLVGVTVVGATPALTLTTDRKTYTYGQVAAVTAHLGPTHDNRTVQLQVHLAGYPERDSLKTGTVDANGYLSTSFTPKRSATFSAWFAGDEVYEPRMVLAAVGVRVIVKEALSGYYGTSGAYKLYHRTVDPRITATFAPHAGGSCATYLAERFYSNAWHQTAKNYCISISAQSQAVGVLTGDPVVGTYRVNVTYEGDSIFTSTTGAWLYLKFT